MSPRTQFCIQELGLGQPNGLSPMPALLRPQVSVVTNIGKDHIKSFCSLAASGTEDPRDVRFLQRFDYGCKPARNIDHALEAAGVVIQCVAVPAGVQRRRLFTVTAAWLPFLLFR